MRCGPRLFSPIRGSSRLLKLAARQNAVYLAGPNIHGMTHGVAALYPLPVVDRSQDEPWRLFCGRTLDERLELVQRVARARELDDDGLARRESEQSQLFSGPHHDEPPRRGIDLLELGA